MNHEPEAAPGISAQLPVMGLPGQNGVHIVVPMFPLGDPRNEGGPGGLPGEYEVTFTFNRPGYPLQSEKLFASGDRLEGDSHLEIPSVFRVSVNVEEDKFVFEGKPNSRNFLSALVVKLQAQNLRDAHDRSYKALMPMLSNFAILWDVPLTIYQTDVKELRRGTLQITTRNPFREVSLKGQWAATLSQELMTYGAIYREALITDSTTYQFLCFFRLVESMQARRKRLARDAARRAEKRTTPREVYPRTRAEGAAFLDSIFPVKPTQWDPSTLDAILVSEALGKEFNLIVKTYLKPIRDSIAHTLLQRPKELILVDDPLSRSKVETWLPPIKCVLRAMLKTDFGNRLG